MGRAADLGLTRMDSSTISYAGAADLLNAYDARQVGDFVKDDNTRASASALLTDGIVDAALLRASGDVEMAALAREAYTAEELAALEGAALAALKGLVCDIAFWHLKKRRQRGLKLSDVSGDAAEQLERLRKGELIFPVPDKDAAAGMHATPFNDLSDPRDGNYGRTVQYARRFFGRRQLDD
jgi:hypothetical protein